MGVEWDSNGSLVGGAREVGIEWELSGGALGG